MRIGQPECCFTVKTRDAAVRRLRQKWSFPIRNVIGIAAILGLFAVVPAMAATCPGIVAFQDAFLAPNAAYRNVKPVDFSLAINGGRAEASFQKPGISIPMQYMAAQFGDVSVCASVSAPVTDKAEDQAAGVIFWAVSSSNYYCFEVSVNGQFIVAHQNAPGDWDVPLPWEPSDAIKKGVGVTNVLRAQTVGGVATVFINGQQVGTFTDTAPPGGGLTGFILSSSNTSPQMMDVSDFSVSIP